MAARSDAALGATDREFVITRVLDAPRELVFKAWTNPEQLGRWWGPRKISHSTCRLDVRAGGAYRIVMHGPGGVEYPLKGVFREVVEPERIVMTMDVSEHAPEWHDLIKPGRSKDERNPAGELLTTVTFEDVGGKTRLTVRTLFETAAIREAMVKTGMNEGWSESLERLGELLVRAKSPTLGNGKICYVEIPAMDIDRSAAFYQSVFGWEIRRRGDGRVAFNDAVSQVSGAWVTGRRAIAEVGLLVYIMVFDMDAAIKAVVANGGRIVQPVGADAPEITARFADPAGNIFGLYQQPV